MNPLSPKEDNLPQVTMPMLPQILQSAMPLVIPQMEYDSGFISNWLGNRKRGQIAKSKELEAQIAEASNREVKAKLDTVHQVITFSAKLKDTFEEFTFKSEQRKIWLEKEKAELVQVQLKNMLMNGEVEINQIELQIKKKELEGILNGTS